MDVPEDLQYTQDHEWLRIKDDVATVGITAYAAETLGDIVYVDLPQAGASLSAGDAFGEIESTKSVSELFAPVDGEVLEVNEEVKTDPALINSSPFDEGWLLRVRVSSSTDLLDAKAYTALVAEQS